MAVGYCVDTSLVVAILRGKANAQRHRLVSLDPLKVFIPSVVLAELLHGCEKSAAPAANRVKVHGFISPFATLPFDAQAATHYAEIKRDLEKSGRLIGNNDLLIAATARAHGFTLISRNDAEFSRVPGLQTEDWL